MASKTDFTKIPSISGNNGYSLRCPEVKIQGQDAYCSYTVCQHTILAYKENRLPVTSFTSCATAIAAGKCQALKMMVEEIRKSESIYYIDMPALIREIEERNLNATSLSRKREATTISNLVQRVNKKPETTSPDSLAPVTDVYAALVEAAVKEST